MSARPEASAPPADVFITHELARRAPRKTSYRDEKRALQALARQMIDRPGEVLLRLVDLAMELTGSVSGGISLYEAHPAPGVFRWHHLRGLLEKFNGETTPRDFSPCGVCLDRAEPTLTLRPERFYTWLAEADISLPEVLLVPLFTAGDTPLGTLWIVSEHADHFDSGHARTLTELAAFAGIAVHMLQTEQRLQAALEQQAMLTQEMSHRMKNLFMVVQGMIHVSARSAASPADMEDTLSGRLQALAGANALVRRTPHDPGVSDATGPVTDLADLVARILAPHERDPAASGRCRFRIDGPPVQLGERAANGFALVCHELATNAAKYGALTRDAGRVHVSWQQDDGRLEIVWRERGGPAIAAPPAKRGFGTTLADRTVVGQFRGTLSHDWQEQGLSVTISVPIANLSI